MNKTIIEREKEIAGNYQVMEVPVDDVISDLKMYGGEGSREMISTFLDNTKEETRRASCAGRKGQVVYLALGDYKEDRLLALLSAHDPGTRGTGGRQDGNRRFYIVKARGCPEMVIDPETWAETAAPFYYEDAFGGIRLYSRKDVDMYNSAIEYIRRKMS